MPNIPVHETANTNPEEISSSEIDLDQDGYLDQKEIQKACKETGYSDNYDEIRATLKDVSTNAAGKIDVEEFIEVR